MAIICRKYNLLFIMTPRTACTAIGELLCERFGGEFIPSDDIVDSRGLILVDKKHSTLSDLIKHKILTAEEANSLLKVAAVRNPFDSLVSLYFKQRSKYQPLLADPASWVNRLPGYAKNMRYARAHSFNRWVLRVSYRKLIKRLLGFRPSMFADHTRGVDVVIRYESIEADLGEVFRKTGMGCKADIPMVNRTDERANSDYRSFYSRVAELTVTLAYSGDLRTYGYRF
ncbi:MAG TPA: sulfotransferase family 2 domain-containing protein [Nitrososphaera sp.]|nr:sulfotransferase family 2 domain-containing protein [Nitrososphaera sp.]